MKTSVRVALKFGRAHGLRLSLGFPKCDNYRLQQRPRVDRFEVESLRSLSGPCTVQSSPERLSFSVVGAALERVPDRTSRDA